MDDTSTTTAPLDRAEEEMLVHEVTDEALEAAAGTQREFTALLTDCRTLIASCCG